MYRTINISNHEHIKIICNSLVYPNLIYCSTIWGGAYHTYSINSLFTNQKKVIYTMFHSQRYDHTHPCFSKHKLLTLLHCIHLKIIFFIYNSIKNSPANTTLGKACWWETRVSGTCLSDLLKLIISKHSLNTNSKNDFQSPISIITTGTTSITNTIK